ncbi:MAG: DUF5320 domain-containing protein [Candidatus Woesearchaeota archaeon]
MPAGDRTGPLGDGPLTGRGLGPCGGRRAFRGRGLGRGFRRGLFGRRQISNSDEKELIDEELQELEKEREYLKKRKEELNG